MQVQFNCKYNLNCNVQFFVFVLCVLLLKGLIIWLLYTILLLSTFFFFNITYRIKIKYATLQID